MTSLQTEEKLLLGDLLKGSAKERKDNREQIEMLKKKIKKFKENRKKINKKMKEKQFSSDKNLHCM